MQQSDGTYVMSMPCSGDSPQPLVDPREDVGQFVKALTKLPHGRTMLGHGKMTSYDEYTKLWSEINGVQGRYQPNGVADFERMMPGGLGREQGEMFAYMAEFGYDGGNPHIIHPIDVSVCHDYAMSYADGYASAKLDFEVPYTSMAEYIKANERLY